MVGSPYSRKPSVRHRSELMVADHLFLYHVTVYKKTLTIILARHEESRVIDHRLQVILAKIFNLPISQLG